MIRVAVVDDHAVVLAGLEFVLSKEEGMEVVATSSTAEDIVGFYERNRPDVLLLDIRMPVVGGLDALKALMQTCPDASVAMLTTSDLEEDIFNALSLGARGYVMKDERPATIAEAVRAIAAGGTFVPEGIRRVFDMRRRTKGLSERERTILQYAAKGLDYSDIAKSLGISINSVKTHVRHIFAKIGADDRTEAVALGIARGIIEP